jgi:hypothetical protein
MPVPDDASPAGGARRNGNCRRERDVLDRHVDRDGRRRAPAIGFGWRPGRRACRCETVRAAAAPHACADLVEGDPLQLDRRDAAQQVELERRRIAEVDDAAADERAAVVDADEHLAAVGRDCGSARSSGSARVGCAAVIAYMS